MNPLVTTSEGCDKAGARATRAPAESLYSQGVSKRAPGVWLFPIVGIVVLCFRAFIFSGKQDSFSQAASGIVTAGIVFGYMAYRRSIEGRPWSELGFVRPELDDLWTGLAAAALHLAAAMLCARLRLVPSSADFNIKLATVTGSFGVAALCLNIALDSFAEECIFRAYLIPRLEAFRGTTAAVLISSVLFGLLHYTGVIPTTLTGMIFAAAFLRRRSIWAPWIAHAAGNATVLLTAHYLLSSGAR